MSKIKKKKNLKFFLGTLAAAGIIFLALLVLVLGVYKYNWNNRAMRLAEKTIPFPAIYIKGVGVIGIGEIKENSQAVKKFYESQDFDQIGMRVDFDTEQGQKRLKVKEKEIINKMIENKVIEVLAKKRGISITDSAVDQEVDSSIEQFGNRQNLMSELSRLYGWSLDNFKQKVVKPELYAEKLSEIFADETETSKQETKIKSLHERVAVKKEDFSRVAQEASEGESSANGGDLGWSAQKQLIPEMAEKAFSMKVGEISDVIRSPLGFHIIKLDEKKSEDGQDLVHLRQIFVKTATFGDWLKEQMKKYSVFVFLKDYQWNGSQGQIEFKNEDLRKFEENLDVNSQGDPSVFP